MLIGCYRFNLALYLPPKLRLTFLLTNITNLNILITVDLQLLELFGHFSVSTQYSAQYQNLQTEGLQATLKSTSYYSKVHDVIEVTGPAGERLKISFQRTIRVPDYDGDSELPPGMGAFPLYDVADYKGKLHNAMSVKGGLYFPMYCEYLFF